MSKSTAVLADAVDPRAIGTDTMRAVHYRYQYNPDALAAPALLQSFHACCSAGQPPTHKSCMPTCLELSRWDVCHACMDKCTKHESTVHARDS